MKQYKATAKGFHGGSFLNPGDIFHGEDDLQGSWFHPLEPPKEFVPNVEVQSEEEARRGKWHQKFTLSDPTDPDKVYPVDYIGDKLDLTDDAMLAALWRKYGPRLADVTGD